jgi:predicted glycoside hydrolase/deacetylase ChbG (UPF0249 family)
MQSRLLIVNADDFGYSSHVNDRILGLMDRGEVTSATIMANAPAFEEAAERQQGYQDYSFGVHLNCTEFRPLTQHAGLLPLLTTDGSFSIRPSRVRLTPQLLRGLFHEWSAQIDRVHQYGITISHLDSHEHVHTIPTLFPVLKAIQRKYGIRVVRKSVNIYEKSRRAPKALLLAKNLWNTALKRIVSTTTTDIFLTLPALMENAERPPAFKTAEVMTHPGAKEDIDTNVLMSNWRDKLSYNVRLIPYNQLNKAA